MEDAALAIVFLRRHPERERHARALRRAAFTLMAAFSIFLGLFLVGDAFSDPGGWEAARLTALWAVPFAAALTIVWLRPSWSVWLLGALTGAVIAMAVWFALAPEDWRRFENRNGPVRDVVLFLVAAAVALLGLRRTRSAGVMLIVLGSVPILVSSLGSHLGFTSLIAASFPTFLAGVLYVLSAAIEPPPASPGAVEPGNEVHPQAA